MMYRQLLFARVNSVLPKTPAIVNNCLLGNLSANNKAHEDTEWALVQFRGADGPVINFKGLANDIFCLLDPADRRRYSDFSGCGNTINCNYPVVTNFIVNASSGG